MARKIGFTKRMNVIKKYDGKCAACGINTSVSKDGGDSPRGVIDHIIPTIKGGSNEENNLQLMCSRCNSRKGTKSMGEFIEYLRVEQYAVDVLTSMGVEIDDNLQEALAVMTSKVPAKYRERIFSRIESVTKKEDE